MGMQLGPYEESIDPVAYCDGLDLTEWEDMEGDLRHYISGEGTSGAENPFTPPSRTSVESNKKRRHNDEEDDQNCYDEEVVNDPRHVRFVKHLKELGNSYILKYKEEEDGARVKIKYERDLNVDEESDVEHVRKSRGAAKNINKPSSDRMFGVEDQRKREMGKKQANKLKSKKGDNAKSSDECVPDGDFHRFLQHFKTSKCGEVFKLGGHEVWYEGGRKKNVGKKDNDRAFRGVEIIDPDTFYKGRTPSFSSESLKDEEEDNETECRYRSSSDMEEKEETSKKNKGSVSDLDETTDFRQEVIADLRKPYNKQEHDRLLQAVKHRSQEERHLDLRNGRERSYAIEKKGKSYLDHYPVIKRKLALVQHDELKCLNLLRGFFLYLQQSDPPFRPWDDEECCAITPGSAIKRDRGYHHHNPGPSKTWRRVFSR